MLTLVNGEPEECIPVLDRGLQYGDGLFETIAIRHGKPRLWTGHMQRLAAGCAGLGFSPPNTDQLAADVQRVAGNQDRAVVKIIVTRGSGTRGYRPTMSGHAVRIVQRLPWPNFPDSAEREGVATCWCQTRLARQPRLAGLKHLNRLEQVLARAEWRDEYMEGLMCDQDDNVIEGTMSNLFLVQDSTLITPDLSQSGVAGVMRATVLELAKAEGFDCAIRPVSVAMVEKCAELFLTNSLIGIWPVARLGSKAFPAPGPVTKKLQTGLNGATEGVA